jgi:hypothetical protein
MTRRQSFALPPGIRAVSHDELAFDDVLSDTNIAALEVEMLRNRWTGIGGQVAAKLLPRMIKTLSALHRKSLWLGLL